MAAIVWNDKFSVGVKRIDQQHQRLFEYINELTDAMKQGKGKDTLEELLQKLNKYATEHFATEEKYFDKFKYTGALTHKKRHKEFIQKVSEYKKKYEKGNIAISIELMNYLEQWWQAHVIGEDKEYSQCFNEHGLF